MLFLKKNLIVCNNFFIFYLLLFTFIGTVRYLGPELSFTTNDVATESSDVYSLGILLWEVLQYEEERVKKTKKKKKKKKKKSKK
jgi:serine/threonine protein kinase